MLGDALDFRELGEFRRNALYALSVVNSYSNISALVEQSSFYRTVNRKCFHGISFLIL